MDEIFEEDISKNKKEEKLRKKYEKKAQKILKNEEKKQAKLQKKNEPQKPVSKMKVLEIIIAIVVILSMLFSVCGTLLYYLFLAD